MKTKMASLPTSLAAISLALAASASAATLVDHTFDGVSNDIGGLTFQQLDNAQGGGTANLADGIITTGNTISHGEANSSVGFNTTASINVNTLDPTATGFEITFVVTGVGNFNVSDLTYNGLFFGVVSGTDANGTTGDSLWNNNPHSFGYVAGSDVTTGKPARGYGDNVMRQDAQGGGGIGVNTALGGTAPTNASFETPFTITIGLYNDDTWAIASTGLSTNLSSRGSLTTTGTGMFGYSAIAADLTPYVSLQGVRSNTIDIDRIVITSIIPEPSYRASIPEPSYTALVGLAGLAVILRRRK